MAFAAVFGLTQHIEPLLWLIIFIFYAVIIAKKTSDKRFLHGLLVSVLNGIWIGIIHASFFTTYIDNNPEMRDSYEKLPHFAGPQVMVLIFGPLIGILTGMVSGLFAYLAGKFINKKV